MITKEMRDAIDKRLKAEEEIKRLLAQLPNWGKECTCEKSEIVLFVEDRPNFPVVWAYCAECGGVVEI